MQANKGEWSEFYVFLKLLSEGKIYGADENLNKIENIFYILLKIIRLENNERYEYLYDKVISIYKGNELLLSKPVSEFKDKSDFLFNEIKNANGSSFGVPEIEKFMNNIYCSKLKAPSREKRDITIVVEDTKIGGEPELGFSIKSQIGNPSTLLNAAQTTNFIYEVNNLDKKYIDIINKIDGSSKIKDRLSKISELGGKVSYVGMQENNFKQNLEIIDSNLPKIIGSYVYKFFTSSYSKISDLTNEVTKENPLKTEIINENFYINKIKHFLRNVSLGMTPTKDWDTKNEVTGGFIVVKDNGEILCYHIYNKEDFENYLYKNTKLETASSTRHKFGILYEENSKIYIKLNLQVRFLV
ncbi:MAG: HpaII family restriction endonuclease [Candidatus Gracilibacteria bacterium]|nr:HpaII family restriction endonuclease [Candidatus Gracilibacteria bacterium]